MEKIKKYIFSFKNLFISILLLSVSVFLLMIFDFGELGPMIFIFWILLALSGIGLIILTLKKKIIGKLRLFLLLLGYSSAGFLLGVVFHNMLYALGTLIGDVAILDILINILGAAFFITAVIICPICQLIGIVGTLILWKKLPD